MSITQDRFRPLRPVGPGVALERPAAQRRQLAQQPRPLVPREGRGHADVVQQIGMETYARVKNATGATLANGTAVYVSGSSGVNPNAGDAAAVSAVNAYKKIVVNLRTDEQMGILLPSDRWPNAQGAAAGLKKLRPEWVGLSLKSIVTPSSTMRPTLSGNSSA